MKKNYIKYTLVAFLGLLLFSIAYFLEVIPCKLIIESALVNEIWTFCTAQEVSLLPNLTVLIISFILSWTIVSILLKKNKAKTFNQKQKVLAPIKRSKNGQKRRANTR